MKLSSEFDKNFKFFLRGHGNDSCDLIGSKRGPYIFLSLPTGTVMLS